MKVTSYTTIAMKLDRLTSKAHPYAIYNETNTEYMSAPEIVKYSAKGNRIIKRAERIANRYLVS